MKSSSALQAIFFGRIGLLASLFFVIFSGSANHSGISDEMLAKIRSKYGPSAQSRIEYWQNMTHEYRGKEDIEQLKAVNDFFNGARFVSDIELWGKNDYWATPIEFLARDAGDCEDFSIAKYFTLKGMGMDVSKLRITYVKATLLNQAHMVLAYYPTPTSVPLILDNINKRIKPANERRDLRPIYSFNADNLWLARTRNEQLKAGKSDQLNLWRDLNARMAKELE
ncbi:transglutaminase-like cysteine peptidase [uncultured Porticoccus sp.]|uniref:transglutaminase-like cysteine peptidase n=1 Tax=uncultured Porticoccus sp. TaxID=1256050 RepID=UPI002614DEEA|nr:transglutaminase-like cysteine peptidase [uncultured Porticoccus sp.]